jgi:hypothetical protein
MSFDRFVDDNYTMLFYVLLELFNYRGEEEFRAATFAGRAFGIADVIRRTRYFLQTNRNFFPIPLLKKYGVADFILTDDLETN